MRTRTSRSVPAPPGDQELVAQFVAMLRGILPPRSIRRLRADLQARAPKLAATLDAGGDFRKGRAAYRANAEALVLAAAGGAA
jgi:hypothetical protein